VNTSLHPFWFSSVSSSYVLLFPFGFVKILSNLSGEWGVWCACPAIDIGEKRFSDSPCGLDIFREWIELHGYPLDALQIHALQLLANGGHNAAGTPQCATERHRHYLCFFHGGNENSAVFPHKIYDVTNTLRNS